MPNRSVDTPSSFVLSFSAPAQDNRKETQQALKAQRNLFTAQPLEIQAQLEGQAGRLVELLDSEQNPLRFTLPERVDRPEALWAVPEAERQQQVYSKNGSQLEALFRRFRKLECSPHPAVAAGAALLRWATAWHLFSASLQTEDRFAFDEQGSLLAGSLEQARGQVAAFQKAFKKLIWSLILSPEMAADNSCQQDRERLLRQLLHQGNSLADHETQEIIDTIKRRAQANLLNRGLSISLPYFDDRALRMKTYDFEVIPPGRILFEDYFVLWAARYEEERVQQDPQLSPGSRRQLLAGLKTLEHAFEVPGIPPYRPARKKNPIRTRIAALRLILSTLTAITIKKDRGV